MIPPKETTDKYARDVRQILTGAEVGIRWDNVGPVVEFEYLDARAPYDILIPLVEKPAAIAWVSAQDLTSPQSGVDGNMRVRWSWKGGAMTIHDIDVTTTANTYLVRLGILKG